MRIGILGAGAIGGKLAELLAHVGHEVMASRRDLQAFSPDVPLRYSVGRLDDASSFGEIIIAALPFASMSQIPADLVAGKIVIDAMNYYPERDGNIPILDDRATTTSEMVAAHCSRSAIVKAFNAILS